MIDGMGKNTFVIFLALALVLLFPDAALAEEDSDTFPSALGYGALAVAGTIGGAMCEAIRRLFKRLEDQTKEHQAALDGVKRDYQQALDKLRTESQGQIDQLRQRLELEQKERREETERLLREQQEIMREVMVTCGSISQALTENTKALERLVDQWGEREEE